MNNRNNENNGYISNFAYLIMRMIMVYIRMLVSMWTVYMYSCIYSFINKYVRSRFIIHMLAFAFMSSIGVLLLDLLMKKYNIHIDNYSSAFMYF